jgi:hypothetical protein
MIFFSLFVCVRGRAREVNYYFFTKHESRRRRPVGVGAAALDSEIIKHGFDAAVVRVIIAPHFARASEFERTPP